MKKFLIASQALKLSAVQMVILASIPAKGGVEVSVLSSEIETDTVAAIKARTVKSNLDKLVKLGLVKLSQVKPRRKKERDAGILIDKVSLTPAAKKLLAA